MSTPAISGAKIRVPGWMVELSPTALIMSLRSIRLGKIACRDGCWNASNAPVPNTTAITCHTSSEPDNTSEASIQFNSNGSTSSTSTVSVAVSMDINATRGDRYTINVSPSGTVTADLTKYTP